MNTDLNRYIEKQKHVNQGLEQYLYAISLGVNLEDISLIQYMPIRVYFKDKEKDAEKTFNTIVAFFRNNGFEFSIDYPIEHGSWFKKVVLKSKKILQKEEVQERLQKFEHAIELEKITKVQAEADKSQMEGLAAVITSLNNQSEAAIQIGSILLIKTENENGKSVLVSRNLSRKEQVELEKRPELQKQPAKILDALTLLL